MTFERHTLSNGLQAVIAPLPHLHAATISVLVKSGSRYETAETNGISHFFEHMLFKGNRLYPSSYELNFAIEALGGTLFAATHVDYALYQLSLPPETLHEGLRMVGEIFRSPLLHGMESEKAIIKEEILGDLDEHGIDIDVDNISRALMFPDHPMGFKITGTPEHIDALEQTHLREHWSRFYVAQNMVLSIAGALDPAQVLDSARQHFADLRSGEWVRPAPYAPAHDARLLAPMRERWRYVENSGSQTDVRLCFLNSFGENDERWPALQVLLRILDDGLSTRLHRRVCDEKGLAYHVFAGSDPYEDCSVIDVGASLEHSKTPEVLGELLALLAGFREQPVAEHELDKARKRYTWDAQTLLDDSEGMSVFLGTQLLMQQRCDAVDEVNARVQRVTQQDIIEVAREVFQPERVFAACVGVLDDELQRKSSQMIAEFV
jgi:predicted Zn-dependent peptidase